jgi:tetratricopeptide (TPR) repeat protein
LENWKRADQFYWRQNLQITDGDPAHSWPQYAEDLSFSPERLEKDPLLSCVFWEKRAFFDLLHGDFPLSVKAYQAALKENPKPAHLYYNLSVVFRTLGDRTSADRYLRKSQEIADKISFHSVSTADAP